MNESDRHEGNSTHNQIAGCLAYNRQNCSESESQRLQSPHPLDILSSKIGRTLECGGDLIVTLPWRVQLSAHG